MPAEAGTGTGGSPYPYGIPELWKPPGRRRGSQGFKVRGQLTEQQLAVLLLALLDEEDGAVEEGRQSS